MTAGPEAHDDDDDDGDDILTLPACILEVHAPSSTKKAKAMTCGWDKQIPGCEAANLRPFPR